MKCMPHENATLSITKKLHIYSKQEMFSEYFTSVSTIQAYEGDFRTQSGHSTKFEFTRQVNQNGKICPRQNLHQKKAYHKL